MCIICRNEYNNTGKLRELNVSNCKSITSIPYIMGIKKLFCNGCTSLTSIPNIDGLKELWCYGCTSLISIPNIQGLKILYCRGCTSLTNIPKIQSLQEIYCNDCPWLNHLYNPHFKKNISLLKQLQKWLHYNLLSKKIKRYLESERFTGWYYSPNGPGGKRAVKRLNFLASCYQG